MSGRGASQAVQAEAAKPSSQPVHLFELYLDGAATYATDAYREIVWNGNTYPAVGHFIGFDQIEETADLKVSQTAVVLSGVDQSEIAGVLTHNYIDRRLVIRKAFLSTLDDTVIIDPISILDGRCDAPVIEEDPDSGTCTVSVPVSSHWIDFERTPGRHTNHDEQQIWFPGDLGFEFVSRLNKDIKWGAK
ncbi:MAG: hypothetical protein H6R10_697 [Rhodocyclaceae bacterium]|nr:hypothetical protein [Rhodocyclaceae bacterium]